MLALVMRVLFNNMETEQKNGVEIAIVIADIYGLEDHRQLFRDLVPRSEIHIRCSNRHAYGMGSRVRDWLMSFPGKRYVVVDCGTYIVVRCA